MTLMVGTLAAAKIRVVTPWNGPWFADCEAILGDTDSVPSGPTTVLVGGATLVGTVDPRASGRQGATAYVRVVAGAGGWDKPVAALELHNDAGILSNAVLSTVAAAAGETAVDNAPTTLGVDYVRFAGVASKVFGTRPWYVDGNGLTQVGGARPPATAPADLLVAAWDPSGEVVEIVTDTLLLPGLSLSDARWDGAIVLRDIEQVFEGEGSKATAICSSATISRAQTAFKNAVIEASGIVYARRYRFRVVAQGADGRLTLQAVNKGPGAPDSQLITPWYGVPGLSAKVTPGMVVHGVLVEGDPTLLVVVGFDATAPLEVDLVASTLFKVSAPITQANGEKPVALADPTNQAFTAITSGISSLAMALKLVTAPLTGTALAAAITAAFGPSTAAGAVQAAQAEIPSTTLQAG